MATTAAVIAKIQKLLNAAGRTPEEAAAFAAKAQEIMLEHGLAMAAIEGATKQTRSDVHEGDRHDLFESGRPGDWKERLFRHVASTSGVWASMGSRTEYKTSKAGRGRYAKIRQGCFVGFPADVAAATEIFYYLVCELERQGKAYTDAMWGEVRDLATSRAIPIHRAEEEFTWKQGTHPLKAKVSWFRGASDAVGSELFRQQAESRTRHGEAKVDALIVNREGAIKDYWYQKVYGKPYADVMADIKAQTSVPVTAKEQERRERAYQRARDRQDRADAREAARTDWSAYDAGTRAGRAVAARRDAARGAGSNAPTGLQEG